MKSTASYLLIIAAIAFWLSWFLMPDQGTADTYHILQIVKDSRKEVFYSVILQIFSSVIYIPALFALAISASPLKKSTFTGIVFLAIGAMGMCADAFFHLLAYFMTDESVNLQKDVLIVMNFMQTQGIVFLLPLLLLFFIGSLLISIGLKKQQLITKIPKIIFLIAFITAIGGGVVINKILGYGRPVLVLIFLGLFALGQIIIAKDLLKT
jgi:hypothetical protein